MYIYSYYDCHVGIIVLVNKAVCGFEMSKFVLTFHQDDPLTALRLLKSFTVDEFTTLCESNMGGNVEGVHPLADCHSGPYFAPNHFVRF